MITVALFQKASFQKDSVGWRWHQLTQRLSEWIEAHWTGSAPQNSNLDLPQWRIPPEVMRGIFFLFVGGILAWILWRSFPYWRSMWSQMRQWQQRSSLGVPSRPTQTPQHWILKAQHYARQENYTEACRALYFALLQGLHDRAAIPSASSRTDGEYIQLLPRHLTNPEQCQSAAIVLSIHQKLCFSPQPIDYQDFLQCQAAVKTLSL